MKISGFKVDLAGVEAMLGEVPGVGGSAAAAHTDPDGMERLLAWVHPAPGATLTGAAVRAAMSTLVPRPMVPDRVVVVDEFPRLGSGKTDRKALVTAAGMVSSAPARSLDGGSMTIARLFAAVLDLPLVDDNDDFFDIGGDSLRAARLFAEIHRTFGVDLPTATIMEARTPRAITAAIKSLDDGAAASRLVTVRSEGSRPPFFVLYGGEGDVLFSRSLADLFGPDQPVYAIEGPQITGHRSAERTIEATAERCLREIRGVCPSGPTYLFGYSFGGLVAWEISRRLEGTPDAVELLVLGDTAVPGWVPAGRSTPRARAREIRERAPGYDIRTGLVRAGQLGRGQLQRRTNRVRRYADRLQLRAYHRLERPVPLRLRPRLSMDDNQAISAAYTPRPYRGEVLYLRAMLSPNTLEQWEGLFEGSLTVAELPLRHDNLVERQNLPLVAEAITAAIDRRHGQCRSLQAS